MHGDSGTIGALPSADDPESSCQAAVGASDSDSDVDAEVHDFDAQGALPEVLTALHTVKSGPQRNAQLAADCHEDDKVVAFCDSCEGYPKRLHFLHQKDGVGESATTAAMVLVSTNDQGGVNLTSLSEFVMSRSGT